MHAGVCRMYTCLYVVDKKIEQTFLFAPQREACRSNPVRSNLAAPKVSSSVSQRKLLVWGNIFKVEFAEEKLEKLEVAYRDFPWRRIGSEQ